MVDSSIVKSWVERANEDFQYAKLGFDEGLELYSPMCFHFHQAVEKYLKAYIIAKGLSFQKIHDLEKLAQICAQHDGEFDGLVDDAKTLNPYYIGARYPDFVLPIDKSRAEKALEAAERIISLVKSKLGYD